MKKQKKSQSSAKDKVLISIFSVVIAISLLCVAGVFVINYRPLQNNEQGTGNDNKLNSDIVTPSDIKDKAVNILVAGIDYTEKAGGNRGKLTDVIMVVSFDMKSGKANILQIPRDTFIGDDYPTGKINAIYSRSENGGIEGLANRINKTLSLTIDHYVTINMDGFITVVDKIGGVEVDVPKSFTLEGVTIKAGKQVLDGAKAEIFVRERYSRGGDLGRIEMQQLFLKAAMEKVFNLSMTQVLSLAPTLFSQVTTDMSIGDMLGYYKELVKLDMSQIRFHTLPVIGAAYGSYSVVSIKKYPAADLLNEYFRPYSDPVPAEKLGVIELNTNYDYTPGASSTQTQ